MTRANVVATMESTEGTPYLYGGTQPFHGGADCSGDIQWVFAQYGYPMPRTTEGEYWTPGPGCIRVADPTLAGALPGDIVEFEVPSDGGVSPQHVGMFLSKGVMVDDPHTGAVVRVETIPNVPGEIVPMGYVRPPFVSGVPAPGQPAPAPAPTPPPFKLLEARKMNTTDKVTGGEWIVDSDGHIETWDGAPDLGGINYPGPWGDWQSWGIVFGIRATSDGGYDIILRHNEPFSPEGGPAGQYFSPIHFPRTPAPGA
jgi:hypothetical protein